LPSPLLHAKSSYIDHVFPRQEVPDMHLLSGKILSALVSVSLAFYVITYIDVRILASTIVALPWPWLFGIMLLLVGNLLCVSWRLDRLLWHFGAPQGFKIAFRANVSGLASSLFVISILGSILGRQLVLQRQGISPALITILTGYERVVLLLIGGSLAVIGSIFIFGSSIWEDFGYTTIPPWQVALAIMLAVALTLVLAKKGEEIRLISKVASPHNIARVGTISGITLCAQAFAISTYVLAFLALGVDAPIPQLLAGAAAVSFAASLPISINGWGVRELAAIAVFGQLGASPDVAVSASVLVGLCSTGAILVATPYALFDNTRGRRGDDAASSAPAAQKANQGGTTEQEMDRILAILCGLGAAILLFFQIRLEISGNAVTVNLADPIALSALAAIAAYFLFQHRLPMTLPRPVWLWLGGITLVLLIGFLNGVLQFGVTPWALSNRLFGWLVILGYVACGAMLTTQFGVGGRIRLIQTLLAIAVIVVVVHSFTRFLGTARIIDWIPPYRFEGFSANRNALAFQLNIVLAGFLAWGYRLPITSHRFAKVAVVLLSFGILQTGSLTGLITYLIVLLFLFIIRSDRRQYVIMAFVGGGLLWLAGHFLFDHILSFVFGVLRATTGLSLGQSFDGSQPRMVPGFDIVPSSLTQRWASIQSGFQMWLAHPVLGAGLGAGIQASRNIDAEPIVIHSTIVWLFAELGTLGAAVVLGVPCYYAGRMTLGLVRAGFSGRRNLLDTTARCGFPLIIGLVFFLFSLAHDVGFQRLLWLIIGAMMTSPCAPDRICRSDGKTMNSSRSIPW